MSNALLTEFYEELVATKNLTRYSRKVRERYTEGTLQRLLTHPDSLARRAAVLALRLVGSTQSNGLLAARLHDEDKEVQDLAQGTLWTLWFRADHPENNRALHRLTKLLASKKHTDALLGLNALIEKAPHFAEAYNQRAILHWQRGDYKKSIVDCERVLKLNPHHFGAQAGMGQCYIRLKRPAEALKAFRLAYQINPAMDGVAESIQSLEMLLEDERPRDERK